jgi:hypothetical protein
MHSPGPVETADEALKLGLAALKAAGSPDAHKPYRVDGQLLPDFWLIVPRPDVARECCTSAMVDARTGETTVGGYQVATIATPLGDS